MSPDHQDHAAPPAPPADADAPGSLEEFRRFRERMNAEILGENNLVVNRFFALDGRAYEAGALDVKTKELLGLVASLVLRCDDCITYHVIRCREEGVTDAELFDAFNVGLIVGGSIVIPHLRRAVDTLDEINRRAEGEVEA
jgi:AhpD family alkylhydroperoxidase